MARKSSSLATSSSPGKGGVPHQCNRWWRKNLQCPFREEEEHEEDRKPVREPQEPEDAGEAAARVGAGARVRRPGFIDKFVEAAEASEPVSRPEPINAFGTMIPAEAFEVPGKSVKKAMATSVGPFSKGVPTPAVRVQWARAGTRAVAQKSLVAINRTKQFRRVTAAVAEDRVAGAVAERAKVARQVARTKGPWYQNWQALAAMVAAATLFSRHGQSRTARYRRTIPYRASAPPTATTRPYTFSSGSGGGGTPSPARRGRKGGAFDDVISPESMGSFLSRP